MSWFRSTPKPLRKVYMFDMDKIREMESLTPEQIITLIANALGTTPEKAVVQARYGEVLSPLFKEVLV